MRKYSLLSVLGLVIIGVIGCAAPAQKGEGLVKYERGRVPLMQTAPEDGDYAVYKEFDTVPLRTYALKKGDPLGFKAGDTGTIIIVADGLELTVGDQTLIWRIKEIKESKTAAKP